MTGVGSFTGRRVAVTGCGSGIGERVAQQLIDHGAEVVGLDLRPPTVQVGQYIPLDLGDPESIAMSARVLGAVDALVNVAGVSGAIDPARMIGINFVGTRELTEAVLPSLPTGGAIVSTASLAASRYLERRSLVQGLLATRTRQEADAWCREHRLEVGTGYAISKDALVWYTLERAVELAARGIRVNAVAPGMTDTPILDATRAARGDDFLSSIPMPLGRIATPHEQAAVLVFLVSPAASYVTGQIIWVDGGLSAAVLTGAVDHVTGSVGVAPES